MSNTEQQNKKQRIASLSSKELLYSEYVGTSVAEHAIEVLEAKNCKKPAMQFQKSSVLTRIQNLLPLIEKSEELKERNADLNIENVEEDKPYVEMNVTCINGPAKKDAENESSCSDFETKGEVNLPKIIEVVENSESQILYSGYDAADTENSCLEKLKDGSSEHFESTHLKNMCDMSKLDEPEHSSDCTDSVSSEDSDHEIEVMVHSCKTLPKKKLDRSL